MTTQPADLPATERWFVRRGLPMFIEEYDNGRDVWTRAVPVLVFFFLLNTIATIPVAGFSYGSATGAEVTFEGRRAFGGLVAAVLLLAGYVLWNRAAGRRWFAPPERVDWPVLAIWLAAPMVITFAATGSWASVLSDLVVNALLLVVIWVVTRYALVALLWWAVRRLFGQFGDVYRLATRALPLQLLVITVLFLTTEVWQSIGTMTPALLWVSIGFFVLLALGFLVGQVRDEARDLDLAQSRDEVVAACQGTPMADEAPALSGLDRVVPLSRRQRTNLTAAMAMSRLLQVFTVALLVWAFFVGFGLVAISVPVQETWLGGLDDVGIHLEVFGNHGITGPLLRVSTFLAAFSAFSVTVSGASDAAYRESFLRGITDAFSRSLAVRRAYLARRRACGLSAPEPQGAPAG